MTETDSEYWARYYAITGERPAWATVIRAIELFAAEGVVREPGADDRQLLLGKIATAEAQGIHRGIALHGAGPRGWPPCGRSCAAGGSGGTKFHGSQRVISAGAFEPFLAQASR